MQTVTVTKLSKTKKGRGMVYFDGKHAIEDSYLLGNKCPEPPLNARIEVDTNNDPLPDGRACWWLNSWGLAKDQSVTTSTAHQTVGPLAAKWELGPAQAFISNVIAHAIQGGLIKKPADMAPWAAEAYVLTTKQGLDTAMSKLDDDKIPY